MFCSPTLKTNVLSISWVGPKDGRCKEKVGDRSDTLFLTFISHLSYVMESKVAYLVFRHPLDLFCFSKIVP